VTNHDWRKPLLEYLWNPNLFVDRKTKYKVVNYVTLGDELYKKSMDEVILICLGESKAYIALAETHEGICGSHQAGEKMKWSLFRQGYYWPTILKDCINYTKSCEECQKHGPIQQVPANELHSITKPCPFRGWTLDLIGQIHPPSSKGHKYILVVVDYFTKWVEAIPLKNVDQGDIINFIEQISFFDLVSQKHLQ